MWLAYLLLPLTSTLGIACGSPTCCYVWHGGCTCSTRAAESPPRLSSSTPTPHPTRDPSPHPNAHPDPTPDQVAYYFTGCAACVTLSGLAGTELTPSEQGVPSLFAGLVLASVEHSATQCDTVRHSVAPLA